MKYCFTLLALLSFTNSLFAQISQCELIDIKHIGGDGGDGPNTFFWYWQNADNTLTIPFYATSSDGELSPNCWSSDGNTGLIGRMDVDGQTFLDKQCMPYLPFYVWPTPYVFPMPGGGSLSFGTTDSNRDVGMQRTDAAGNVLWTRQYGSSGDDRLVYPMPAKDGGYWVLAEAHGNDGDVGMHYGDYFEADIWLLKLDSVCNLQWSSVIGGSGEEAADHLLETADSGCLVFGETVSTDYDAVTNHSSSSDILVCKVSATGEKIWSRCYGGSRGDGGVGYSRTMRALPDNDSSFYLSAATLSTDGDLAGRVPAADSVDDMDYWLMRMDTAGHVLWSRTCGGPGYDIPFAACRATDGSIWLGGTVGGNEPGKDVITKYGKYDPWVAHFDSTGVLLATRAMGGDDNEWLYSIVPLPGGRVVATGVFPETMDSEGISPMFPKFSFGGGDCFMAYLGPGPDVSVDTVSKQEQLRIYPNPAHNILTIDPDLSGRYTISITDASGKSLYTGVINNRTVLDISRWPPGPYYISVVYKERLQTQKIIIR